MPIPGESNMFSNISNFYHSVFTKEKEQKPGLGTFVGVFLPSVLMLFGVIIFLRLGWVVGQVGIATTLCIITLASCIALLTTLSMSSIATNIQVGKGGVYYILSRSLGLEIGSAIGLPLYLKQTLSISFSIVGFSESLHCLIPTLSITTIGIWTLSALTIFAAVSLKGAMKIQIIIFVSIIASLISFFSGGNLPPVNPDTYTVSAPISLGFWTIFAIFFPALTGIESSVSLSGDLRDPSKSLPRGTIWALLVATLVYMSMSIFLVQFVSLERLTNDTLIMQNIAKIPALIVLGIWGATLSSALGGLLAAPRTLVAISEDGVVSSLFAKTYGKAKEPLIATLTTFTFAFAGIYFGSINIIAPLLTMICLICYTVLNFSAAAETYMGNPSWRPTFRVHWIVPLVGGLLSMITMLMIDSGAAILATCFIIAIYLIAKYRNISASWDDIRQGILLFLSRFAIYRLAYAETGSSRSWRPHFLVFTDKPEQHSTNLIQFSQAISQNKGFLTMAAILPSTSETSLEPQGEAEKRNLEKTLVKQLEKHKIQALVQINYADKVAHGMHQMIENYGIGPLMPNTVVFGGIPQGDSATDFAKVVKSAYEKHCNVVIISDKTIFTTEDEGTILPTLQGDIHIWWDDFSEQNTVLMHVLAYMLQRNPAWKKTKIFLKGTVSSELERAEKLRQFSDFATRKRLHLQTDVYIAEQYSEEYFDVIKTFSKNAGIVFLSLRCPGAHESIEHYASYLQNISQRSVGMPPSALVLSSEHTPSQDILN